MRGLSACLLSALVVLSARPAEAACTPGQLNASATCDCPAGYKSSGDPGNARCLPTDPCAGGKCGGTPTVVKSASCKPGDFDDCNKKCDSKNYGSCVVLGRMYKNGEGVSVSDPDKAFNLFKKACDGNDLIGCVEQGRMHETGSGTPKDNEKALRLYGRACDAKVADGCFEVAGSYYYGVGVTKDVDKSLGFYEKACNGKHLYSCNRLGVIYYDGAPGVPKNETKAVKFFGTACDGNEGIACANLANAYEDGRGVPKDLPRANLMLEKSCNVGYGAGCNTIGLRYGKGQGVTEDMSEAYRRFDKACSLGHAYGCHNAGFCLETGKGVAKDEATAATKQDKACKGGAYEGCYSLADQYLEGRGVSQNDAKAAALYKTSCDDGKLLLGCRDYGMMLYGGKGVTKNVPAAITYTKRACDGENGLACNNLAYMYESGKDIPKDLNLARTYYQKSCQYKYQKACERLATLGTDTTAPTTTSEPTTSDKQTLTLARLGMTISVPAGPVWTSSVVTKTDGSVVDIVRRTSPANPYLGFVFERTNGTCAQNFSAKPGKHRERFYVAYSPAEWTNRTIEFLAPDSDGQMGALTCHDLGGGKLVSAFILYSGPLDAPDFVATTRPVLFALGTALGGPTETTATSNAPKLDDNKPAVEDDNEEKSDGMVHGGFHLGGARTNPEIDGLESGSALWLGLDFLMSGAMKKHNGVGLAGKFAMQGAVGQSFIGDFHFGLGPGIKLGPIHLAPLAGAGIDGVTGGEEYYRSKVAGYAFVGGDLHLSLGSAGLGGSLMLARRAVSEVPSETRLTAWITFSKYIVSGHYWIYEHADESRPKALAVSFGWSF
jgi:TPR repeat protein